MELSQALLDWLLDERDPGPRYLALRDVLWLKPDDPLLLQARREAHLHGPIATIMENMDPEGWWVQPALGAKGATWGGYAPKYRSIVWALILLSQLGASVEAEPRISTACRYLLRCALADGEKFSCNGQQAGTIDCLQGNLLTALLDLGFEDSRLEQAFDWMACSITGEGIAPSTDKKAARRFYAVNCGPGFCCSAKQMGHPPGAKSAGLTGLSRFNAILAVSAQGGCSAAKSAPQTAALFPSQTGRPETRRSLSPGGAGQS